MRVHIDFENKTAYVVTASVSDAGWTAFYFAWNEAALIEAGWIVNFCQSIGALPEGLDLGPGEYIIGSKTLRAAINSGPPKSCCHDCCCKGGN